MGSTAMRFMVLVSLLARTAASFGKPGEVVAAGASFGKPGDVVTEAGNSLKTVLEICAATGAENPAVCIAAAGVTGAYWLVEFAVDIWNWHAQEVANQNRKCELFKQDFQHLTNQFNLIADNVKEWKTLIDTGAWGNLSVQVNDVLHLGKSFIEMTKSAMSDVEGVSLTATSAASKKCLPAAAMVMIVFGLTPGQENQPVRRVFQAGATVMMAFALQGCPEPECDTVAIRNKLGDMNMNMKNAMICMEDLKGCVTPAGKPICSAKMMHEQDRQIQGWLQKVKVDIESIAEMKGLHLKTPAAVHAQQLLSMINHTWKLENELVVNTMPRISHMSNQMPAPVKETAKFAAFQTQLHHKSEFEDAMKSGIWSSTPVKPAVKADEQVEVGKCGDGSATCDEVCCYNGDELKACCSYAYPICDLVHGQCHKSEFEAAMKSGKIWASTPLKPVVKADKQVEVSKCGDGTDFCDEVCCFNSDELKACCTYAYPICDLVHSQCHKSNFEAAMKSGKIGYPSKTNKN